MGTSRGTLLLTLAQAWHALTGYLIFITVGRVLGQESFGGFALVVSMMTTLEVFVVDGVPRAVSFHVARRPEASRLIMKMGLRLTTGLAILLGAALVLGAPLLGSFWELPALVGAVRLSALDFLAFVGFAVLVQAVNGLQGFGRQAGIWLVYSTAKVIIVVAALELDLGVEGAIGGYVAASFVGSLGAVLIGMPKVRRGRIPDAPPASSLLGFGTPVATQALALLALVNFDLWAAAPESDEKTLGAYGAAAILARALYFIFKAVGDALFPAVARHLALGAHERARGAAQWGLGLLLIALLPATGLATGAAGTSLEVLFAEPGYRDGGIYLELLAPALAAWTITAVLVALVSAASRPWRAAIFLGIAFVLTAAIVLRWAHAGGPLGAALGSLAAAVLACSCAAFLANLALGAILPWRSLLAALLAGVILDRALRLWHPESWWLFPYALALYAVALLGLLAGGALPRPLPRRRRDQSASPGVPAA